MKQQLGYKKWSKIGRILCAILLLCLGICIPVFAENSKTDDTPVDFVLVLDCSGSMNSSDPERLTMSAAKMFVDMLPAENARLAVIAFGKDYGNDSQRYDLSSISGLSSEAIMQETLVADQIKLARNLADVTAQEMKADAKSVIDTVMTEQISGENYTAVGYALEAAYQVLEDNGAASGSAAIILMSDGRIAGQEDKTNSDGYDFESVNRAVEKTREQSWPIYCMELNFDGGNVPRDSGGTPAGRIGYHQMREVIPQNPDEHVELKSATEAQAEFANIFSKFFQVNPEPIEPMVIQNGECSREFTLDDMIAETNITLTGTEEGIASVTDIVITDPNGQESTYTENTEQQNRIITFEKQYMTIKLMTPQSGTWKILVHGSDNVEIGLYAVSIHEMDLQLTATAGADGFVAKGSTIDFNASFVYHNNPYVSSTVYQKYPGILYVDGPDGGPIAMAGSDHDYSASFTFSKSGEYKIRAYVDDANLFRNGRKESGEYTFTVGNIPTAATEETIGDQEVEVLGEISPIDCTKYFTNEDNDEITYSVIYDQTSGLTSSIENGILNLRAGESAGSFRITIQARDTMMETPVIQEFTLNVVNQPLHLMDGVSEKETINFAYNADSCPLFLLKLAKVPIEHERVLRWSEYFMDPDGTVVDVFVDTVEDSDAITMVSDENGMTVSAAAEGQAVFRATAADASDSSVVYTIVFTVNSMDASSLVWKMVRIPLILLVLVGVAVIVALIAIFGGRKIYGIWDVSGSGCYETDRKLGSTRSGKKSKCRLDNLLDDLNIPNGFGNVEVAAGNNLNKKVIFRKLGNLDSVEYNGNYISDPAKVKKLAVGKKQNITLEKDGISVTLERH